MNIFYLDSCPVKSAQYLCDKHVIKMTLESTQLLCTAHHYYPNNNEYLENIYKSTHKQHPCSIWVRNDGMNYKWLENHAYALCYEYQFRYEKRHKCADMLDYLRENPLDLDSVSFTEPPKAMPILYQLPDTIEAYRFYYKQNKLKNVDCRWTKREKPEWLEN